MCLACIQSLQYERLIMILSIILVLFEILKKIALQFIPGLLRLLLIPLLAIHLANRFILQQFQLLRRRRPINICCSGILQFFELAVEPQRSLSTVVQG